MAETMPSHAIAIIGMAGRFPGASDLDQFWQIVRDGVDVIESFSDEDLTLAGVDARSRARPNFVRRGTALADAEHFDAAFFGVSPREAQILDPQQRIFLECAWQALEHAGHGAPTPDSSVGVYGGVGMNSYLVSRLLRAPAFVESVGGYQIMLGSDKDFLCTRVSYKLDLRGPSVTIQTACSTSLVAVEAACRALQRGECDMALAGGVSVPFPQRAGYLFEEGMIFSPDGLCRPFDANAKGTRAGAGAGIVVLKRLDEALADGDTVHAVIRGIAINNDGAAKAGFTAPSVSGQIEVIAMAHALADVDPRSISYLEAHGTATPLGDPIEVAALTSVFRASTSDVGFCRLGSLKANLGHLDAAAGVAGLIKTALALSRRELPPLVNFESPNPALKLDAGPFVASAEVADWPATTGPRRAGVSSFGIGGTNAHAILEEAPATTAAAPARAPQLLVLSAKSATALDEAARRLADHLESHPEMSLADAAWTLQVGRRAFSHRRAIVAARSADAIAFLRDERLVRVNSTNTVGESMPVAFLFSGQGSQHATMGKALYDSEPVFGAAVDRCASILQEFLGLDLRRLMFETEDGATLEETRHAQPALFVVEYALAMLWQSWGVAPKAMMGHSIGEYVAAHLAGTMALDDALKVVAIRAKLMHVLAPGGMAAVHLGSGEIGRWLGDGVELAAANTPTLCTVSGPSAAIDDLLGRLKSAGIEFRRLHTSHAFHSAMMEPARAAFVEAVRGIALHAPSIPYVSNVTGTWITPQEATSPEYYGRHLRQTVRFEAGLRTLAADPALRFLEVGPGTTLTTLARSTLGHDAGQRVAASLAHPLEHRPDGETMRAAAARLWLAGVAIDWLGLHAGASLRRVPLPTYPFERKHFGVDVEHTAAVRSRGAADVGGKTTAATASANPADWFWSPSWERSLSMTAWSASKPLQVPTSKPWLVFRRADDAGLALARRLTLRGCSIVSVLPGARFENIAPDVYTVRPTSREDHDLLFAAAVEPHAEVGAILHLWNVGAETLASEDVGRAAFYGLLTLAQHLARAGLRAATPVVVVSSDRCSVSGAEKLRLDRSLLLGPIQALMHEVPFARARAVDLLTDEWSSASAASIADALLAELAAPAGDTAVAYRGGFRWVAKLASTPLAAPQDESLPLRQGGTYLVTGGVGGIGLAISKYLAGTCAARLVLTSRSTLPERSTWNGLLADPSTSNAGKARLQGVLDLEALGAEVVVDSADVSDEPAMSQVVARARARFGAVHGVIHAAGLLGHGGLDEKTREACESVLRPKVEGTLVLDRLLAGSDLDFFALCSSVSTSVGGPGMTEYSAANAFLDAFASSGAARSSRRTIAIGWDAWRDVGFAADHSSGAPAAAMRLAIRPAEGVDALRYVLAGGPAHVYVSRRPLPQILVEAAALAVWLREEAERSSRRPAGSASETGSSPSSVPEQTGLDGRQPLPVETVLLTIWSELLGVESIRLDDDFFELGGHSLLATRVLARVEEACGIQLALRDVFEAPTVRRLAERMLTASESPPRPPRSEPPDDEREEIEF